MKIFLILMIGFFNFSYAKTNFKKVVTIVFENTSFEQAKKEIYFQDLAKKGTLFTHFSAVTHPSLPNYVSMIAGSTLSIKNDDDYNLVENHIGDLLEAKNLDWRVYAEDFPEKCFLNSRSGKYARKHVPFLSFTNVTKNLKRCDKIQDLNKFFKDVNQHKLQAYSMIVPNLDSDGHDSSVKYAANWFKKNFDIFINGADFPEDLLFIITFDEGMGKNNSIYTLFLGKMVKDGVENGDELNHYSILKMIEDNFALSSLHREDERAKPINDIWKN